MASLLVTDDSKRRDSDSAASQDSQTAAEYAVPIQLVMTLLALTFE